jgi:predicted N-acetyltransferase YhbS
MPLTTDVHVRYENMAKGNIEELLPILKQAKMTIAYPHLADPVVAKIGNEIIGFAFAQLLPHWEPLYVVPEWRGTGVAEELAKRALDKILKTGAQRIIVVAQSYFAEQLCMKYGFHPIKGTVYVREPE